jgi:hypothetical protein
MIGSCDASLGADISAIRVSKLAGQNQPYVHVLLVVSFLTEIPSADPVIVGIITLLCNKVV